MGAPKWPPYPPAFGVAGGPRVASTFGAILCVLLTVAPASGQESESWWKALRPRVKLAEEFAYRLDDPGDVA
jgi:hypothetical protein